MSSLNLPILSEEKPEIKIPEIPTEAVAPEVTQNEIFVEKKPDTVVNNQEQMDIKPVKPKRKLSDKQIAHLAKMRENRAAKRKTKADSQPEQVSDPRSPTVAPRRDVPVKKADPPASQPKPDNFYQFMDYMEKYKSIKKSWRERDAEKRKASAPKPVPQQPKAAPPVPQTKPKPAPVKKNTTNILNIKKPHNPYSSYF